MNQIAPAELSQWRQAIAHGQPWSLAVKVVVNCPRRGWQGQLADGSWKVGLAEPAADNKANEALLAWLAKELACPAQRLRIISGQTSRRKIVRCDN